MWTRVSGEWNDERKQQNGQLDMSNKPLWTLVVCVVRCDPLRVRLFAVLRCVERAVRLDGRERATHEAVHQHPVQGEERPG